MSFVDEDGSGCIDINKFIHLVYICQNTTPNDLPMLLFLVVDSNNTGFIDGKELQTIYTKMGAELAQEEAINLVS